MSVRHEMLNSQGSSRTYFHQRGIAICSPFYTNNSLATILEIWSQKRQHIKVVNIIKNINTFGPKVTETTYTVLWT